MKAMILAAGRGERLRPLTDTIPKPMLMVGARPLIEWHLHALARAGITDVVINLSWLGSTLREHLGEGARFGVQISYSDEGEHVLETGGGIHKALPLLGAEPFWLVNGDVYTDFAYGMIELQPYDLAHLLLVPNPPHNTQGDFCLTGGRISNAGPLRYTYSGLAILRPELLAGCRPGRFPLAPLLRAAADAGRVSGALLDASWHDVGTPERLHTADAAARARTPA